MNKYAQTDPRTVIITRKSTKHGMSKQGGIAYMIAHCIYVQIVCFLGGY